MKKTLPMIIFSALFFFAMTAFSEDWQDFLNDSLKQRPSERKRKTSSGKRLLIEKKSRISRIDADVPFLIRQGNYSGAENLLKESLRLTVELYQINDLHVTERLSSLGLLYMEAGRPADAVDAFLWALRIGEPIAGKDSYELSNLYRFLSVAYYQEARYDEAEHFAGILLGIYLNKFGEDSPEVSEVKELLKKIYRETG
ncbi:MAG: tetratricopeptide repeat protein [Candidatus Omnitrophota bacterium]